MSLPGRAVVATALVAMLAGCSGGEPGEVTVRALVDAGFADPVVEVRRDEGLDRVEVTYRGGGDAGEVEERRRAARAAEIVWDTLDVRFGELVFFIEGSEYDDGRLGYSQAGLRALFGPRPETLDTR